MSKSISILDKDYLQWVDELIKRYQACQVRAAVKVNAEQLRFNWLLGHDIVEMNIEQRWGRKCYGATEQGFEEKHATDRGAFRYKSSLLP
jgi:hypothetical protein